MTVDEGPRSAMAGDGAHLLMTLSCDYVDPALVADLVEVFKCHGARRVAVGYDQARQGLALYECALAAPQPASSAAAPAAELEPPPAAPAAELEPPPGDRPELDVPIDAAPPAPVAARRSATTRLAVADRRALSPRGLAVLLWLRDRGGEITDAHGKAGGRLAEGLQARSPGSLRAVVHALDDAGFISRDVRGKHTYAIRLEPAGAAAIDGSTVTTMPGPHPIDELDAGVVQEGPSPTSYRERPAGSSRRSSGLATRDESAETGSEPACDLDDEDVDVLSEVARVVRGGGTARAQAMVAKVLAVDDAEARSLIERARAAGMLDDTDGPGV